MARKALVTFDFPSAPTVAGATTWYVTPTGTNASGTWGISVSGNAGTATTLQTARSINLVSFNGSANVTIPRISCVDDRAIAPTDGSVGYISGFFTSWANDNTAPWADALLFRSYTDGTAGNENLLMLRRDALGMRVWQQTFNSGTAFSTFKDVAWTDGTNATGTWGINVTGSAGSVPWSGVSSKPTTISGYGITNAVRTDASTTMDLGVTHTARINSNNAIASLPNGITGWEAQGNGTGPAVMTFHRPSAYAGFFGLDTDNKWKVGGWSMGANSYEILHQGNYTIYAPSLTGSGASGSWGISITGSSASCSGNAATVTNGVYTTGNQTIAGDKTFSGTTALAATSTINGAVIGYRDVPVTISNTATTFALTDAGKAFGKDNATAYTYTIPANGTVAFPIGTVITVFNNNATSNITIAITTDTLRLAGTTTTGSRTVAPFALCTLFKVSSTVWLASGAGVT